MASFYAGRKCSVAREDALWETWNGLSDRLVLTAANEQSWLEVARGVEYVIDAIFADQDPSRLPNDKKSKLRMNFAERGNDVRRQMGILRTRSELYACGWRAKRCPGRRPHECELRRDRSWMNSWWADRNLSPDEIRRQLNTSATTSTDGALAHPAIQVAALNVAREELRKAITLIDVAQRSFRHCTIGLTSVRNGIVA
jgi:hypothetical protein